MWIVAESEREVKVGKFGEVAIYELMKISCRRSSERKSRGWIFRRSSSIASRRSRRRRWKRCNRMKVEEVAAGDVGAPVIYALVIFSLYSI